MKSTKNLILHVSRYNNWCNFPLQGSTPDLCTTQSIKSEQKHHIWGENILSSRSFSSGPGKLFNPPTQFWVGANLATQDYKSGKLYSRNSKVLTVSLSGALSLKSEPDAESTALLATLNLYSVSAFNPLYVIECRILSIPIEAPVGTSAEEIVVQ